MLREIKKAQLRGLFKRDDNSPSGHIGRFGKRMKEHVQTKLDVEQKSIELMKALKANRKDILERMLKE